MMTFATMGRLALASALLSVAVPAQDSTSRGVRIGLNYDPGSKPGIIVLPPVAWANGDSVRRILERDLDFSDRFNVISLPPPDASTVAAASGALNYPVFAKTGAVALVHVAPTARGVHVVLHDVAKAAVAREEDFSLPATVGRDWRHAVHGIADAIEQWITGTRGISQTRVAFIRSNVVRLIDSDGHGEEALPMVGAAVSPAWHPNGGTIAYNTFGTESRIVLHDLRTGRNREFPAQRNSMYLTPMFAPDGRSLVYAISTENGADL
jgi:TolB protein